MKNNFGILVQPHLTEKTMGKDLPGRSSGRAGREYTFVVATAANKHEVRQAIADRFKVTIEDVRMLNMPRKERRRGKQIGWKSGFKKAVVKVAEGQTIEMQ